MFVIYIPKKMLNFIKLYINFIYYYCYSFLFPSGLQKGLIYKYYLTHSYTYIETFILIHPDYPTPYIAKYSPSPCLSILSPPYISWQFSPSTYQTFHISFLLTSFSSRQSSTIFHHQDHPFFYHSSLLRSSLFLCIFLNINLLSLVTFPFLSQPAIIYFTYGSLFK